MACSLKYWENYVFFLHSIEPDYMSESSMRAIIIKDHGGPEQLQLWEWEKPLPGPDELLVRIHATALNRADSLQRQGKYPPPQGASPILGLEMAGEVVGAGGDVNKWQLGDKVCGLLSGGGYAEYCIIHQDLAMPIPTGWTYGQAAAIPEAFLTAYQGLFWLGKLEAGQKVLIHAGGSGVGTAAIQLAKTMEAEIYITASSAKHEFCHMLGASYSYDYKEEDFSELINEQTHHKGVDVIMDFVGAPYFQRNLNCIGLDGKLVMLGFMGGTMLENVNLGPILRKRVTISGSTLRNRTEAYKIQLTKAFQTYAWPRFEANVMKPIIDKVFPWQEVSDAHRYMEANQNTGKIILEVD